MEYVSFTEGMYHLVPKNKSSRLHKPAASILLQYIYRVEHLHGIRKSLIGVRD